MEKTEFRVLIEKEQITDATLTGSPQELTTAILSVMTAHEGFRETILEVVELWNKFNIPEMVKNK